jgi:hypothetical protein
MIVGLPGLPANQLLLVSEPTTGGSLTVDAEVLPYVAVLGAIAGVWVFFKVLELIRKLFIPLVLGAALILITQTGVGWPFRSGGVTAPAEAPSIPPMGDFLPR